MEINVDPQPQADGVLEASDQDFEAKVIQRSQQIPVLVDFWAPWCGPCRVIGPVLEKLAQEWAGRFELVKVNMDESPMLAQVLRIQSIPAVKLFVNGRVQDEFMGAYPEPEVARFLEHNLPSEKVEDATVGLQRWQLGDTLGARTIFQEVLQNEPKNAVALIGLGHCLVDEGDLDGAEDLARQVNVVDLEKLSQRQEMEKLLDALRGRLLLTRGAQEDAPAGDATAAAYRQACQQALQGNFDPALEALLEIVRTDRKFQDDAARKAMLAIFDLLPLDSPLLASYRQRLSSLLFA